MEWFDSKFFRLPLKWKLHGALVSSEIVIYNLLFFFLNFSKSRDITVRDFEERLEQFFNEMLISCRKVEVKVVDQYRSDCID
ncbi:hypothetical protein T03_10258 [Trichinella britovi]|uniref:Uncharacterized protein n=1 Tax=Trichinella britovi TaxID=45882 RepID=A0A0V1C2U6_TRIBR|nr:hypothetical protein T03_10258 [Trichinella britovi]